MPTSYESLKLCMTRHGVQSCSMAAKETGSELQLDSNKDVYYHQSSNIFIERIICKALHTHECRVSIGVRLITSFRLADDIDVNAEEEEEAGVLVDHLDTSTTKHKIYTGLNKTKGMTNNPNGYQREVNVKGQRLEAMENVKYLGPVISNGGSKPEILSRIAQTTTALPRLKVIWRDKNISLASKV